MLKKKRRIDPSKKKKTGVLNLTTSIFASRWPLCFAVSSSNS
jgi:hypothetical protein